MIFFKSNVEDLSSQDIRKIEGLEEGAELERLLLNVAALVVMDADQQGLGVVPHGFSLDKHGFLTYLKYIIFALSRFGKIHLLWREECHLSTCH